MDVVWIKGEVIPRKTRFLNIPSGTVDCQSKLDATKFRLSIEIQNSIITIKCEIEEYKPLHMREIYLQSYKLTTAMVDLAGLHLEPAGV